MVSFALGSLEFLGPGDDPGARGRRHFAAQQLPRALVPDEDGWYRPWCRALGGMAVELEDKVARGETSSYAGAASHTLADLVLRRGPGTPRTWASLLGPRTATRRGGDEAPPPGCPTANADSQVSRHRLDVRRPGGRADDGMGRRGIRRRTTGRPRWHARRIANDGRR